MNVFTTEYETCCGDTLTEVYDSIDAVITKLKLMQVHGTFDEHESFTIRYQQIVDDMEMQDRLKRVKQYYDEKASD